MKLTVRLSYLPQGQAIAGGTTFLEGAEGMLSGGGASLQESFEKKRSEEERLALVVHRCQSRGN